MTLILRYTVLEKHYMDGFMLAYTFVVVLIIQRYVEI